MECALGCATLLNYTRMCPGIESTMCPETFFLVNNGLKQCLELCSNFGKGYWLHYTTYDAYFSCFSEHEKECDYWHLYRNCSPMGETVLYGLQIVSFVCCVLMLYCLRGEIHKGMLQQSLFMANIHNLLQGAISEQAYSVWAMYSMDKNTPSTLVSLALRYTHLWMGVLGSLGWSIAAAVVLLKLTRTIKQHYSGFSCACKRLKIYLVVLYEAFLVGMTIVSVVAHEKQSTIFFIVLVLLILVALIGGLICYSVPLCRAWRLRRAAIIAHAASGAKARRPERVQIKPFGLLLFVSLLTYLPALLSVLAPRSSKNLTSATIISSFLELVGLWNLIALMIVYCGKNKIGSTAVTRAWLRDGHLVSRGNAVVVGSHSFARSPKSRFWWIKLEATKFGASCLSSSSDSDAIVGDVEQAPSGALVRWTKRPSKNPGTLQKAGLPLNKFHLFIEAGLAPWFPEGCLSPLRDGFSLGGIISDNLEDQKLQLAAVEAFEQAALQWSALHDDRVIPAPEDGNTFEQAQLNWAYEEAVFNVKATIGALVRWRRDPTGSEPTTPRSAELKRDDEATAFVSVEHWDARSSMYKLDATTVTK